MNIRQMFTLILLVLIVPATLCAQEKVYIPAALGFQEDSATGLSTENVLRVNVLGQQTSSAYNNSGAIWFFKDGLHPMYLDFGDGRWGTGEAIFLKYLGEETTFSVRNQANGIGIFPPDSGTVENFLIVAELDPTVSIHAWAETWKTVFGRSRLIERHLVVQPPLLLATETSLPVFVTEDEDTKIFLSNPSDNQVTVALGVTNRFGYLSVFPGLQGERVFVPRSFHSRIVLAPWETRVVKTSEIVGLSMEDTRGNLLSDGTLKILASAPILARIE